MKNKPYITLVILLLISHISIAKYSPNIDVSYKVGNSRNIGRLSALSPYGSKRVHYCILMV